jgi:hypothetical protein
MTAKRGLKRRVRERQARTGERYTAARRQLLAERSEAAAPEVATEGVPGAESAPGAERAPGAESAPPPETKMVPVGEPVSVTVAAADTVPVVQLHDISAEAARLGFQCKIAMFAALRDRVEPAVVLVGLRDALIGNPGDPGTVRLFGVAFGVRSGGVAQRDRRIQPDSPRSPARLHPGVGAAAEPGKMVTFRVAGAGGDVPVLCMLWGAALVMTVGDDLMEAELSSIVMLPGGRLGRRPGVVPGSAPRVPPPAVPGVALEPGDLVRVVEGPFATFSATVARVLADQDKLEVSVAISGQATRVLLDVARVEKIVRLFLIYDGRRYLMNKPQFVIGRTPVGCDLAIRDGLVSRKHAAVIRRDDMYYVKDLDSTNGIHYKGMQIDNKRIDEGDVFQIGTSELRFTYRAGG